MPIKNFTPAQGVPTFATQVYPRTVVTSISTAGNVALTADQILGGKIVRDCSGAARTDTLPSASALVAAVPGAAVGTSVGFDVRNVSGSAVNYTLAVGSGGTLASGSAVTAQNQVRYFTIIFTNVTPGSEAYSLYSDGASTF